MVENYYRLENCLVSSGVDEFDNSLGPGRVHVYTHKYKVVKETPKGVMLDVHGKKRFVLSGTRKKFACASLEEAKESFIARKEKQIRILSGQIRNAKEAIDRAKGFLELGGKKCVSGE